MTFPLYVKRVSFFTMSLTKTLFSIFMIYAILTGVSCFHFHLSDKSAEHFFIYLLCVSFGEIFVYLFTFVNKFVLLLLLNFVNYLYILNCSHLSDIWCEKFLFILVQISFVMQFFWFTIALFIYLIFANEVESTNTFLGLYPGEFYLFNISFI